MKTATALKTALTDGHNDLSHFYELNPDFEILGFDFYDPQTQSSLKFDGTEKNSVLAKLQVYQRLLRLDPNVETAEKLLAAGFDSAHSIAAVPQHIFVKQHAGLFDGNELEAQRIHQRASSSRAFIKHLVANVHSTAASHHFRATLSNNVDPQLVEYFEQIPTYQDLFGGLNYCRCQHCSSIFSPAAYFLDMMRITDDYITEPNTTKTENNIPPGYTLQERRPDLFNLKLDCANTDELVPYLQIVNGVLEARISAAQPVTSGTAQAGSQSTITLASSASSVNDAYDGMILMITGGTGLGQVQFITAYAGNTKIAQLNNDWTIVPDKTSQYLISANPYHTLAAAPYPFNLPFNLPLVQIRSYLQAMNTALSSVYMWFDSPVTGGTARGGTSNTITLAATSSSTNNFYATMRVTLIGGTGVGQTRDITTYNGATFQATVSIPWTVNPDGTTQYHIFDQLGQDREYLGLSIEQYNVVTTPQLTNAALAPYYGYQSIDLTNLAVVEVFTKRTGLTREQLTELLTQQLSTNELAQGLANDFYINATGENLPYMRIIVNESNPDQPYYEIANLSIARLDRLNRFIRLSQLIGWRFEELNWALVSIRALETGEQSLESFQASEINEQAIKSLAGIQRLKSALAFDVITLCSLWSNIKTIGQGNGPNPIDLFDTAFNNPALLRGQDPYTSVIPIPFDPNRPLTWIVSDNSGQNGVIRGRLLGALNISDDDLTLLAGFLLGLLGQKNPELELTTENLTWLYRLSKGAAGFKLTISEYLLLLGLMYPDAPDLAPSVRSLIPSIDGVIAQLQKVNWFSTTRLTVYSALYILTGLQSPYFKPGYDPDNIAPLIENLSTISVGARVAPESFVFNNITAKDSERVFQSLISKSFITNIGIILNQIASYQNAAIQFPLTSGSFVTADITVEQAEVVFQQLQQVQPPILIPETNHSLCTLGRYFNKETKLDFLFPADPDAVNKRNQVRTILLAEMSDIKRTEFAFLFPLLQDSFITRNISPAESARAFSDLTTQSPPIIILNPASGQANTITAYDGPSRTATVSTAWTVIPNNTSIYQVISTVNQGQAQAGSSTSITLAANASSEKNAYNGLLIKITGGTGAGQTNTIVAYNGGNKIASVAGAWTTIPDNTSAYQIIEVVNAGTARGGATTQIKLAESASPDNNSYTGMSIAIVPSGVLNATYDEGTDLGFLFTSAGSGQTNTIAAYDGPSRTATVSTAWTVIPNNTSVYQVISTVNQGQAQAGSSTSITLAASASSKKGAYNGLLIKITGGTGAGQTNTIVAYNGGNKIASVAGAWTTVPDNTSTYQITEVINEGTARGGATTQIVLAESASADSNSYDGMTVAIINTPEADIKRGDVKRILLETRQNIEHSVEIIDSLTALQTGNAMQGLSDFLNTTPDRLAALIPVASKVTDLSDFLVSLLTPIAGGQVPPDLPPFIRILSRGLVLMDALAYSNEEMTAVAAMPQAFNVTASNQITFDNLETLSLFKTLVVAFGDQDGSLIQYFRTPVDADCPGDKIERLAALTHWNASQICQLIALFWPQSMGASMFDYTTVMGVVRLKQSFDISLQVGLDVSSLLQIERLSELPVLNNSGQIIPASWQTYVATASLVLAAVNAKFGDEAFAGINDEINSYLDEQKRDALLGYTIWLLQQTFPEITDPASLYQYLLMDVEMSGCDFVSYIAQAIASIQLYMQRCRMMLEPGVTDMSNIPDVWWEWMSGYRLWEVNRKIFLYPENYVDPALRSIETPQFEEFTQTLQQTDISDSSVSTAYTAYFTGFSEVANLVNCGSYICKVRKPGTKVPYAQGTAKGATTNTITLAADASPYFNQYAGMTIEITGGTGKGQKKGIVQYNSLVATVNSNWSTTPDATSTYVITGQEEVERLFFIARTNTQPYDYYYRSLDNMILWSPWEKIDLTINSPFASPIYAFNRLFLFWVEPATLQNSQVTTSGSTVTYTAITDTNSRIVYSFSNTDGAWAVAQVLRDNIVIDYEQNYVLDAYIRNTALVGLSSSFNPTNVFWQKPYPLHLPQEKLFPPIQYPSNESIFVNYGFGWGFVLNQPVPQPAAPPTNIPPDQLQIEQASYNLIARYNQITQAPAGPATGFLQFTESVALDSGLTPGALNTAFINYLAGLSPQPYYPLLNRSTNKVGMNNSTSWNTIIDNYYSDDIAQIPLGTTATPNLLLLNSVSGETASIITVKNRPGSFIFDNGDEAFLVVSSDKGVRNISDVLLAMAVDAPFPAGQFYFQLQPFTITSPAPGLTTLKFAFYRLSTSVVAILSQRLIVGGIPYLLTLESQLTPELPFSRLSPNTANVTPPPTDNLDFDGAYGLNFWEVFFYAPFLVADSLNINQRFSEAKTWYEYIFNPTEQPDPLDQPDAERFWRFLPFRSMDIPTLTQILTNPAQLEIYNNDPFDPDAVARLRIVAYAKAIVMKYIKNLIDWGDFLFMQDTRESITQATNLYVMASDLLGEKPEAVGECQKSEPLSYNEIKQSYTDRTVTTGTAQQGTSLGIVLAATASSENDAYTGMYISITAGTGAGQQNYITSYSGTTKKAGVFRPWTTNPDNTSQYRVYVNGIPEFLIRLENTLPTVSAADSGLVVSDVPFNDINSYFCIPENDELIAYWGIIEDRLFKIRHCMNIQGQVRALALFEPPLNPRDVIRAARSGAGNLSTTLQLGAAIPYYRFSAMIAKAFEVTSVVMQLGTALLTALEKKDAEALALLNVTQAQSILNLTTYVKEQQIVQQEQTVLSLNESLKNAQKRYSYYTEQVAKGLSSEEVANINAMTMATVANILGGVTRTAASIGYAVPQVGSPFAMTYGGQQVGSALSAASGVFDLQATLENFKAQLSLTMAGYSRRASEWQLQADLAGYDVQMINYQIAAAQAAANMSKQDMEVHKASIKQTAEMQAFLTNKFTNEQLYQWMAARLSGIFFQTYSLALELARSAQRCYQFELNTTQSFINFTYWDSLRKGLLSGEGLLLSLNQMDKGYLDNNSRLMEIEKTISLLQLNPIALLALKETGECVFDLPERLFDDDYPGHYARKIASISISIPALVGPYQNIHASLTQLSNQTIIKPDVNAVNFLLGGADATLPCADVLRSNWWINQQITLSRGVSDAGMFEVSFNDSRYLPFEGTGAVSSWKLSLPKATNRFNFNNISDVIIELKYTASDGGSKFRQDVTSLKPLQTFYGSDFFLMAQAFSTQWYTFLFQPTGTVTQTLEFLLANLGQTGLDGALLNGFFFQLIVPDGITTTGSGDYIELKLGDEVDVSFNLDRNNSYLHTFKIKPDVLDIEGAGSAVFTLAKAPADIKMPAGSKTPPPGCLDPAVVQNIVLILFYEGKMKWNNGP